MRNAFHQARRAGGIVGAHRHEYDRKPLSASLDERFEGIGIFIEHQRIQGSFTTQGTEATGGIGDMQVGSLPHDVEVPGNLIMKHELRLVGSFRFAYVFPAAIELAASGLIDLRRLVTRTFPLAEFDAAMSMALARDQAIKVHLTTDA